MVEYGLILGLISIVAIAALTATGGQVENILGAVSSALGNAT
jgi:Flp pilus assembly pilin Flp